MSDKKFGLGRGLGSLIPGAKPSAPATVSNPTSSAATTPRGTLLLQIPPDKIRHNPHQPRTEFAHQDMEEMVVSIKEHGVLQPIIVTSLNDGNYELISGERRLRASKMAGLATIPAVLRESTSDKHKLELALIENIQRKNLNAIEEAEAYQKLITEFGLTQEDVARRVGKSRPVVANMLRLLNLPEEIQLGLMEGKIFASQGRLIASLSNEKDQLALYHKFVGGGVSARKGEELVRQAHGKPSKEDPNIKSKEAALREALGTKVVIKMSGPEKGKIEIEFYSREELNEVVKKII